MNNEVKKKIINAFNKACEAFRKSYVLDINVSECPYNNIGVNDYSFRLYLKAHYSYSATTLDEIKEAVDAYDYAVAASTNHVIVFFKINVTKELVEDKT